MSNVIREHGTAYASIKETAEGSNKFDIFIGKQGVNGKPTYTTEFDGKSVFSTVDNRSQDAATEYTPKALSADGKTKDSKSDTAAIVISLIEQLVKKFIAVKAVKVPKEKVVKEKKEKVAKVKAEKPAKAAKEKAVKVKKEKVAVVAEVADEAPMESEVIADGETGVTLVDGLRYNYSCEDKGGIMKVTVSRNGKEIKTTIAPKSSPEEQMESVTGLAQRLANNYTPSRKVAKK